MFANPLGLLALLAVPAVVGLHLYRRRYRPHPVGALFLWEEFADAPSAGRQRTPLTRSPSFWCELLAALLAALAIAGPRPFASEVPHRVVVLDGSASMAAIDGSGESAWDRGRDWLAGELRALPRRARVTLVASGPSAETLAGPAALRDEALAALDVFTPRRASHALGPALDLAEGLAGDGEVELVTDAAHPPGARVSVHAFGAPLDNVAIVRASRHTVDGSANTGTGTDTSTGTRARATERVVVGVANYTDAAVERALELVALDPVTGAPTGDAIARSTVELRPGGEASVTLTLAGADDRPLVARLDGAADALALDDRATLAPARPRPVRVAVRGAAAVRAAALLEGDRIERVGPAVTRVDALDDAHLVLDLDGRAGVRADATTWVLTAVPPLEATAWLGPFLVERRHRLMDGVSMSDVAWVGSSAFGVRGAPLASAGEAALVVERRANGGREIALNADLAAGTFTRSPDWPILLANLVAWRRDALDGPREVNLVLGEPLRVGAPGGGRWSLTGPLEDAPRVHEQEGAGELVFADLERTGLFALERDGRSVALVGVSFLDASESDLRALSSRVERATAPARTDRTEDGTSRLEWLLALAALALVAVDHWLLRGGRGA